MPRSIRGFVIAICLTHLAACTPKVEESTVKPSIMGLAVGASNATLSVLPDPEVTEHAGSYTMSAWTLQDGNSLHVSSSGDAIRFVELDWNFQAEGVAAPFPGMTFGTTTLEDIRMRLGSNGIGFADIGPQMIEGRLTLLNSYEIDGVIVTFVTAISDLDMPNALSAGPSSFGSYAKLVGLMLCDPEFARGMWGARIEDPAYRSVEWK